VPFPSSLLSTELIHLGAAPPNKDATIREAAQMLSAAGCVDADYAASMLERERLANTFLGHGVAVPHGLGRHRHLVKRTGIAVLQIPRGVEWNPGQVAHLAVAIAAQSDEHITVLRRLTRLMQHEARLIQLFSTPSAKELVDALVEDTPAPAKEGAPRPATDLTERFTWTVNYPTGLHARPALRWVETARGYAARLQVRHEDQVADAKNLVALLQLGLRAGDRVVISADGNDASAALARLRSVIEDLSAQERWEAEQAQRAAVPVVSWTPPQAAVTLSGIGASPGLAIGVVHRLASEDVAVPDRPAPLTEGGAQLHDAITTTKAQLRAIVDDTDRRLGSSPSGIFKAQSELLSDWDLIALTCQLMVEGHGVAWSWNQAVSRTASKLSRLGNPVLASRAADLRDVGRRVLCRLDPSLLSSASLEDIPEHGILVASDLSPSETANLDPARVVGIATAQGGPTSHTAILARTLGVPALVAAGAGVLELEHGTRVIVDGQSGRLYANPSAQDVIAAEAWIAEQKAVRERQIQQRALPAQTLDAHRVEIAANINIPEQAAFALSQGAEGVGLMRTEFLFLERGSTPSEDEQFETYRAMAAALEGRPLVVRALDIGGDKQVAHLELTREENPFLGVRGARLLLRRSDLLEPQLRALYRVAIKGARLSVMFPMITQVQELRALQTVCERIRRELDAPYVPLGIMIEVPAAAIQADVLARYADFFSIGTNDLTQYTLAIDRQNPELAAEADSLHPAVLRLIKQTVVGAAQYGRWVGVCGGLAGDPFGAALLTGLGVSELSMTPRDIPSVKNRLRHSRLAELKALAERALKAVDAAEVRSLEVASA